MSFINFSSNEIQCKVVYYGPSLGGKTTNLLYIYEHTNRDIKGKIISIDTKGDRTLFFDFLSLSAGKIRDFKIRVQLYTVPGQVAYDSTRKLVLKGVDGVVFVTDSMVIKQKENIESLNNLEANLAEKGIDIHDIPLVLQYNKRDLEKGNIPLLSVEELQNDLNSDLHAPYFLASAINGTNVFETLREISKRVVKSVGLKIIAKR
jgi:signal recognition particle receptor subunit beta